MAEKMSQTTPSLQNKPTLEKVNSAPKGSNLKQSIHEEEEKVKKIVNISQTTPPLPNKLTLKKVNSAPKGSLKPSINWEKVKADKLSQITKRILPNNTIMNKINDDYKGKRKVSFDGEEETSKTEALSIKTATTTTKLSTPQTPVCNTNITQKELCTFLNLGRKIWLGNDHMDIINGMLSRKFTKINGFQSVLCAPYNNALKGLSAGLIVKCLLLQIQLNCASLNLKEFKGIG